METEKLSVISFLLLTAGWLLTAVAKTLEKFEILLTKNKRKFIYKVFSKPSLSNTHFQIFHVLLFEGLYLLWLTY